MEDRPDGIDEPLLREALQAWGIHAATLEHVPAGFGDHHWTAADAAGRRWFLTVADLEHKEHCGTDAEAAFDGLRRAMDTAAALHEQGLDFVVAPLRTPQVPAGAAHGETLRRLGARYALSVFPQQDGEPGTFGHQLQPGQRAVLLDQLATLHQAAPPPGVPDRSPQIALRDRLEQAVREASGDSRLWTGGPFTEAVRDLLAGRGGELLQQLAEFDRLAATTRTSGAAPVVTHGEPHPGNLLHTGGRYLMVDWDTVGLAPPERDLWLLAPEPAECARYAETTGHTPDPAALELYGLRWDLEDVAVYVDWLRAPHERTPDTEQAWAGLASTLHRRTADPAAE